MKIENITTKKKILICKIFKKTNLEVFNFQKVGTKSYAENQIIAQH